MENSGDHHHQATSYVGVSYSRRSGPDEGSPGTRPQEAASSGARLSVRACENPKCRAFAEHGFKFDAPATRPRHAHHAQQASSLQSCTPASQPPPPPCTCLHALAPEPRPRPSPANPHRAATHTAVTGLRIHHAPRAAAAAAATNRWLLQLTDGGVLFFRESCYRQSGDKARENNPTHYRCAGRGCALAASVAACVRACATRRTRHDGGRDVQTAAERTGERGGRAGAQGGRGGGVRGGWLLRVARGAV